ncbi:hypothetical protein KIW84_025481 [Lathyrus oleraceus]|uniref:Reverse transcriptase n=1 Tax=Pisum sativum TaxID=3888 RepID=A0A9D4YKN8_PEA|nr:hypothetical protein KIW84_025481 [Pisum sativum]
MHDYFHYARGVRQGDSLSPLLFCLAEDVLSRQITKQSNLQHLTNLFTRYANVAGQWVKPSKLTIFCGAMHQARKIRLAKFVGFPMGFMSFMYLGVPVFRGTPKKIYFQALVGKTKCKLASWKDVLLSNVGKAQLIQYVIHNMIVYSITTYT